MNIKNILKNIIEKQGTATEFNPITDEEIDEMFGTAAGTGTDAQDYVVEHGTDGIWTYRKWASGIAECWGTSTNTVNYDSKISSTSYLYQSGTGTSVALPTNLFTSVDIAIANGNNISDTGWAVLCSCTSTTSSVRIMPIGWCTGGSFNQRFQIFAKGTWK